MSKKCIHANSIILIITLVLLSCVSGCRDSLYRSSESGSALSITRVQVPFEVTSGNVIPSTGELMRPGSIAGYRMMEQRVDRLGYLQNIYLSTGHVVIRGSEYSVQIATDTSGLVRNVYLDRYQYHGAKLDSTAWTLYERELKVVCDDLVREYGENYSVLKNWGYPTGVQLLWRCGDSAAVSVRIATRKILREVYGQDISKGAYELCSIYIGGEQSAYSEQKRIGKVILDSSMTDAEKRRHLF